MVEVFSAAPPGDRESVEFRLGVSDLAIVDMFSGAAVQLLLKIETERRGPSRKPLEFYQQFCKKWQIQHARASATSFSSPTVEGTSVIRNLKVASSVDLTVFEVARLCFRSSGAEPSRLEIPGCLLRFSCRNRLAAARVLEIYPLSMSNPGK